MSLNRRTAHRHDVSLPGRLVIKDETREVIIENLSLGGLQIESSDRLALNHPVKIIFKVPVRDDELELDARVRWNSGASIGLQFEGLRARDVWALNKYFDTLDK